MPQLFKHDDKLFVIIRDMPTHQFHDKKGVYNNEKLKAWKLWLGCDHVLKVEERYLFVEEIKEIEFQIINIENEDSN
jgi:hypothetical protein